MNGYDSAALQRCPQPRAGRCGPGVPPDWRRLGPLPGPRTAMPKREKGTGAVPISAHFDRLPGLK
jgi:hypothetical protein